MLVKKEPLNFMFTKRKIRLIFGYTKIFYYILCYIIDFSNFAKEIYLIIWIHKYINNDIGGGCWYTSLFENIRYQHPK